MLLKEKDEVLIAEVMHELESFIKTKKVNHYLKFNKNLEKIFQNNSNDFIDYTLQLMSELNDNQHFNDLLDNNVKDLMEIKEEEDKVYIVIAIPYLLYQYKSMNIPDFLRKKNFFDNRLLKLKHKLEKKLKSQLQTEFESKLALHDSFINMQDLYRNFKKIYNLKEELIQGKKEKGSLLYDKRNEKIPSEIQDSIKFIVGVVEINKFESIENLFKNSFNDCNSIYSDLEEDFKNLLINQHIESERFALLKPRAIMNALEEGEIEYHYNTLLNVISDVFIYRKKEEIRSKVIYNIDKLSIEVQFFDNNPNSQDYKQNIYKVIINEYIINLDQELSIIIDILKELNIKFNIIEEV